MVAMRSANSLSGPGSAPAPDGVGQQSQGVLRFISNDEIDQKNKARQEADESLQPSFISSENVVMALASRVKQLWADAYYAKQDIQESLEEDLRQRRGRYSPKKLAELEAEGVPPVFLKLTDSKCRAAESWINDIMGKAGDEAWSLEPTEIPDVQSERLTAMYQQAWEMMSVENMPAEEVQAMLKDAREQILKEMNETAKEKAENHEEKIRDQLQQAEFQKVFQEFVQDLTTFKSAFIKGPYFARRKQLEWGPNMEAVIKRPLVMEYCRISPMDVFPLSRSETPDDGYFIRHRFSRKDLAAMREIEGNNTEAIEEVLDRYETGLSNWIYDWGSERDELEGKQRGSDTTDTSIEVLEYRGPISGKLLREFGMSSQKVPDPHQEYDVELYQVGPYTIRAVLNSDPLDRKPLYKASYIEVPGSFWGESLPETMADQQEMCNVAARSLAENMGMASGPQVAVDIGKAAEGADVSNIQPWKVWPVASAENGSGQVPVQFFQPELHSQELMEILNNFSSLADETTGIPKYQYGGDTESGAASTASGLSMLMNAASKGIKNIIMNVDQQVLGKVIDRMYVHNMLYEDDPKIKGDLQVRSRGVTAMIQKETLNMRRNEFLQQTANPIDMEIIGKEGRAQLLRDQAKALEYDEEQVVPDDKTLREREQQEQRAAAAGAQPGGPGGGQPASGGGGGGPQNLKRPAPAGPGGGQPGAEVQGIQ